MGNDETARNVVSKLMHDRFAGKAVALDTERLQFPRNWKHTGDIGHPSMKGGVETCHLRKSRKMFVRKADNRYRIRGVQRRKNGRFSQLLRYLFVNQAMLPELRAAVHDTVPYRCGRGRFCLFEKSADANHRIPLAEDGRGIVRQRIPS